MERKVNFLACLLFAVLVLITKGQDPYKPGPYKTAYYRITPHKDGSPLPCTVHIPMAAGEFRVIMFIGGMYALLPQRAYGNLLKDFTSHGYIVVGVDRISVGEEIEYNDAIDVFNNPNQRGEARPLTAEGDTFLKHFYWLRDNLNTTKTQAIPNWNNPVLMCHSAGCDDTLIMINKTRSLVNASIFLDPVSGHVRGMAPIKDDIRVLTYTGQRSEWFPQCCIPGIGWKAIYNVFTSLKVRMKVKDFGHCDVLDPSYWDLCHYSHFCQTTNNSFVHEYQHFTAGVGVSFMQWALEEKSTMKKYVVDKSLMPFQLVDLVYQDP